MSNRSRATNDVIALTVLTLLTEQPMHPYQIQGVIRQRHKEWAMGRTRSLYHAVTKLADDGLIEPVETSREGKWPERTVYRITEKGREEQAGWLADLVEHPVPEHPLFLVAMSFVACLPQAVAAEALRRRAIALEGMIAGVGVWQRALTGELRLPRVLVLEVELFLALHRAELEWTRSIVAEIETGTLAWDEAKLAFHRQITISKGETA